MTQEPGQDRGAANLHSKRKQLEIDKLSYCNAQGEKRGLSNTKTYFQKYGYCFLCQAAEIILDLEGDCDIFSLH